MNLRKFGVEYLSELGNLVSYIGKGREYVKR